LFGEFGRRTAREAQWLQQGSPFVLYGWFFGAGSGNVAVPYGKISKAEAKMIKWNKVERHEAV
jgi:hypothetical protein